MFIPNPKFFTDFASERPYEVAMEGAAKRAADEAMKIRHHIMPLKGRGSRPAIEPRWIDGDLHLVNTDRGGHLDEWGSVNNPAYAPLRTGIRRAGFDFIEE